MHNEPLNALLQHIASQLLKQSDQVIQEQLGIGMSQYRILRTLETEPRTTQRDIARELGQTEASISRQVKLLLDDGLLHSLRSPKDHRVHLTIVTPKGLRLTEVAATLLERYHRPTFGALTARQQEQMVASLELIHAPLCAAAHTAPKK